MRVCIRRKRARIEDLGFRRMRPVLLATVCALAFNAACTHAPQQAHEHSRATLLLEQTSAQPGAQTRIGLEFEMDKDWHIYWLNPGDSGEPPAVRWELPAGVTAGALEWPTPLRLTTGAGTDYGYEGSVVLPATLSIPAAAQPGSDLPIAGDVRWLVCHDICIPQRAEVKATLHIANAASVDRRAQALLDAGSQRLAGPLPDGFHLMASSLGDHLRLSFDAGGRGAGAVFFPAEPEQIDNSARQEVTQSGGKTEIELKKSEHLQGRIFAPYLI